jgi:proteasome alpha subunit
MEEMQHQVMGYDRAATMFAPDGHILQVEYAEKTVRLGSASIGVVCKDGVVIIADRRNKDKLIVEESANKIFEIDGHIIGTSAGITSDARVLVEKARIVAQQHRITYDTQSDVEGVVKEVADAKQQFTQYGGARPYGVALMIGGFDSKPRLFSTDVTGNYFQYKADAIGEADEKIKEKLRQRYKEGMTIEQGIKLALEIFKEILEENFDIERFDAGIVRKEGKMKRLSGKDIENLR